MPSRETCLRNQSLLHLLPALLAVGGLIVWFFRLSENKRWKYASLFLQPVWPSTLLGVILTIKVMMILGPLRSLIC